MKMTRISILRKIRKYALPRIGSIAAMIFVSAAAVPVALLSPRFFQILIDDVMAGGRMDVFPMVVGGLLSVYLLRFLLDGASLFFGNRLLNSFTLQLRKDILQKYQKAPLSFLERKSNGNKSRGR